MEELQQLTYLNDLTLDFKAVHVTNISDSYRLFRKFDSFVPDGKKKNFIIDMRNEDDVAKLLIIVSGVVRCGGVMWRYGGVVW